MSADIYLQTIRVSDYCPVERTYLGGNGLRDEIVHEYNYALEATVMGVRVIDLTNLQLRRVFLDRHHDSIERGGGSVDEDDWFDGTNNAYWIVIEE